MPLLPPALSLAFNFLSAVGLILINQFVFTLIRFDFPIALSTFHFAVTWLAVELLRRAGVFKAKQQASGGGGGGGAAPMTRELWLLSLAKGLGTPLNNLSLRHNSIAVAQISKLLVTPAILLVQWLLLREKVTLARAAWLALVCGGVGWATVSDVQYPGLGFGTAVVLCWLPCSAGYKTLTSRVCKHPLPSQRWSELQLIHRTLPWAIVWSAAAACLLEDHRGGDGDANEGAGRGGAGLSGFEWTAQAVGLLTLSALGAVLVNVSGAILLSACHPLSHVLLGQVKSCALMLAGYVFFGQELSGDSLVGAVVAMLGIVGYTRANLQEQERGDPPPADGGADDDDDAKKRS